VISASWLEQTGQDLPVDDRWLSSSERTRLDTMRIPKRRSDWRLGRWTAKLATTAYLGVHSDVKELAEIEVRSSPTGAPEVYVSGSPAAVAISISHSGGRAACAITGAGCLLGCDLETIEPRSAGFVSDYFTNEERDLVAKATSSERDLLVTLIWSAKESMLKVLQEGLRSDTRSVEVSLPDLIAVTGSIQADTISGAANSALNQWHPLRVRHRDGEMFEGWWTSRQDMVKTMVSGQKTAPPSELDISTALHVGSR
jgi:4'-phosphopantetheinyl transferase